MSKSSKEWEPELRKIDEDNSELIAFSAMWEVWQDLCEVEKERDDAIKDVKDYLSGLSDEDFRKLLNEHADGDFAVMLRETNALVSAEADVEKLKMDAEHLQYERDEAREANLSDSPYSLRRALVAALVEWIKDSGSL